MIPTEDLEEYRDFLMQACDDLPSASQMDLDELDIAIRIICLHLAVKSELAKREAAEPPGLIHKAIKQEGDE